MERRDASAPHNNTAGEPLTLARPLSPTNPP